MTISGVIENMVADAIVLLAVTMGAIALLVTARWRTHARLLRFLGCQTDSPQLIVFFSTLVVRQFGSVGFGGLPMSYAGPAVPEAEYLVARTVSEAVEVPGRAWFTRLLVRAVHVLPASRIRRWIGPQEVAVEYELSPLQVPVPLPTAATICLGSPGYNYATDFYLSNLNPLLTFRLGQHPAILGPGGAPVTFAGDVGMLQRLRRQDGFPVYIAAGLGTNGTRGALQYLFEHWQNLQKRFGDADFALALGFRWFHQDPFGFHRPVELRALTR